MKNEGILKSFIGSRAFYKRVIALTLPIMLQNLITNFVNMLDNVMVGSIGTNEMTGVAITNQLLFVFNLCIFGAVSGAGIFGAQYFGKGDDEGIRYTLRYKIVISLLFAAVFIALFATLPNALIGIYLKGESTPGAAEQTLLFAKEYLNIMLLGLVPFAFVQCYSSTLRECDDSVLPMNAGISAVLINLLFNYLLIYGNFGFPKLGVKGAAIATVISRFAELLIIIVFTKLKSEKYSFLKGALKSLKIPFKLCLNITKKAIPLMLNETLWAIGIALINQSYSLRGLNVVAAQNISSTFWNVFSVAFMSIGVAIGIILGQVLGSGKTNEALDYCKKLMAFSFAVSIVVAVIYAFCANFIPLLYNTTSDIRGLSTALMQTTALAMPIDAIAHAGYFSLRSGGKTIITMLFDSCFVLFISLPLSVVLCRFTNLDFLTVFLIMQLHNGLKAIISIILIKTGIWIKNIVE